MKIYDYKGCKNITDEKIREARIIKRLTQSNLAAQLQIAGVTIERDSISRIENGIITYILSLPLESLS